MGLGDFGNVGVSGIGRSGVPSDKVAHRWYFDMDLAGVDNIGFFLTSSVVYLGLGVHRRHFEVGQAG